MDKVIEAAKRISIVLGGLILILLIGYFAFLDYFGKSFPLPVFFEIQRIWIIALAIALLVFLATLLVAKFPILVRILVFLIASPFCCLFSYIAFQAPTTFLDTAEFNNYRYYITVQGAFAEPRTVYYVYKCNTDGSECDRIYTDIGGPSVDNAALIVDEEMNEVRALRNDYLIYADGEQPHEILASEQFENNIYYVGVYPTYGSSSEEYTYVLYKCQTSFTSCEQLPFHYVDTGGSFQLKLNDSTNEVEVYQWKYKIGDTLIFSLGAEPQCYVERCTIPSK